jgi:hypothetical protein
MHAFLRVILWIMVCCFLLIVEKNISPKEYEFRLVVALTFLLWNLVGLVFGLRGLWRFLRS